MKWRFALVLALIAVLFAARGRAAQEAPVRIQDVIYGRKPGVALTLDVFKPAKPGGIGVLWMVSGGWFSAHESINPAQLKAFLDCGQTVFAVVHGSQPKYSIPEIVHDIDRATRFVRLHAKEYGVDPDRLGIAGGSAGGHLSLMQGARGADGDPAAKDPVQAVSSKVQAVACFFPPTDLLNYGKPGQNALTVDQLRPFRAAFGNKTDAAEEIGPLARAESPIYFATKSMPPTLIIHGDADTLVPIQQAQVFMQRLEELGVPHRLVVREGKGHGWPNLTEDVPILAGWFDRHLAAKPAAAAGR